MSCHSWVTEGFEAFQRGTFGNGGQNLYVSKRGVLQRIYQFDLFRDGELPLVFANCQNHHESAECYVYSMDGKRAELPAQGTLCGVVADLNGNGYQDVVVGGYYDMAAPHASTDIYFGGEDGYSEKRHIRIPTPWSEDCCVGQPDGPGTQSLAFALGKYKVVRIFKRSELGYEWRGYTDLAIDANLICFADLDGDGYDELIVRKTNETETVVYWSGKNGINLENKSVLPGLPVEETEAFEVKDSLQSELEKEFEPPRRLKRVVWNGRECFTLSTGKKLLFYSSSDTHQLECVLALDVHQALDVAVADFNGDGIPDLAIAARARLDDSDDRYSYIFYNSPHGLLLDNCEKLKIRYACCVSATGNSVLFGQSCDGFMYTNNALLYHFENGKVIDKPELYEGDDMRRAELFTNPDGKSYVLLLNHYSRRQVGFDKAYVYRCKDGKYSPENCVEVPDWCGTDSISADLDDDGWAELLICNSSENSMHLDHGHDLHHFGPKGFEPERSVKIKTDIGWGTIAADFDHDGEIELASISDTWRKLRFYKNCNGEFSEYYDISLGMDDMQYGGGRWIYAVDLNNDGWLEIIIPRIHAARSLILWGGPDGYSLERSQELATLHGVCARAADLTHNGYPDLIIGGHNLNLYGCDNLPHEPHHSFVHIYWNGPEGISEQRKTVLRGDAASSIAIGDFNNDGWLDIFAGSYHGGKDRDINSFVYWNREGAFKEKDRDLLYTHSVSGCLAADFNRDGFVDLAVANHKVDGDHLGYSTVWWNGPQGFDAKKVTNLPTCGPHGMSAIEPGNILTRGPEEYYYSEPWKTEENLVIASVEVEAELPPDTWVTPLVRCGMNQTELENASWQSPAAFEVPAGALLQYRLELGATLSLRSPRVTRVAVLFK